MRTSLVAMCLWFLMVGPCLAQGAAAVVFASGSAQIVGKDGQARAAVRGEEIAAGETIETRDGRTQLRFRDGASMSLQPATRFRVDEFRFVDQGGKASEDDRGFFSLLKGGFRTLSGLIGKVHRQQYKVDTVVATIGIRGTDYSASLTDAGLSVSTFGGLVEVCSDAACILVAPGETAVVTDRNALPRKQGKASESVGVETALPILPTPNSVELPEAAPPMPSTAPSTAPNTIPNTAPSTAPSTTPSSAPQTLGPNGAPITGPIR